MADSPTLDAEGPVGITIKTDGAAIPDTAQVASVRIRREANRIPEAQVIIETGSIPEQDFGDVDGTAYAIGKDITIAAHYGSGEPATLFSGVIVAQRLRIAEPRGPRLELLCRDKAVALTRGRKSALYAQMKDSDVIAQIASDAGLTAEAASTPDSARDQLRHDVTDWDFLRALADRNGHLVLVDAGKITTGPPDTSGAAVLTLTLGEDIIEFDAAANTEGLYATARGLGWDDTAKETVEGQGGALPALTWGDQTATKLAEVPAKREHLFTTPNRLDAAEIETMADSRLTRSALSAIQGQCSFQG
ncbi:MAG: phage late control D family protein, partial [Rhodovulum sp.]